MAGLIAVSIGLGAEKLGRTISDKRLERKEKKALAKHEAIYGSSASSSSSAPPPPLMTTREREEQTWEKRDDAQREVEDARRGQYVESRDQGRRRSESVERLCEEDPPPSYQEVVGQDAARG